MPRAHNSVPSTLRNRNRVTNKTRLKVVKGDIEGDPLSFDDGEEKARVVSTAGVDAEDANEHHLQAVLSAASQRHQRPSSRTVREADKENNKQQDAYIPIPDNTGVVEDYERLYPSNRRRDPVSYIKLSETIEEAVVDALAGGFTYYMDERDKEWLDKNNEAARGEGTSAQGAVSSSSTTTRTSQRSAKAKGKEPETSQPVAISEDEFELVMGIFEKVTQERTPFLHHGLENNVPFPTLSDYQETFATELPPSMFATFVVPASVPVPSQMLRYAKIIYLHWKERRLERQGHRVIPTLNYDESDVKNESYVCFRHRDVKAMRKTRASQASSSEKLLRLQQELASTQELSRKLCLREVVKREWAQSARAVWEMRDEFVTLKRKFPGLGAKEDEELLHDKERVPKRPKGSDASTGHFGIKLKPRDSEMASPIAKLGTVVKPEDRLATIISRVEQSLSSVRERDSCWDDLVDNSYQAQPAAFSQKAFKFILPGQPTTSRPCSQVHDDEVPRIPRAIRTRRGRGGVLRVDRRGFTPRTSRVDGPCFYSRRPLDHGGENFEEEQEHDWRLRDRWMFDEDDPPPVGPDGPDEQDRVLVDERDPKYLRKLMGLLSQRDILTARTDPVLRWSSADGRQYAANPMITATDVHLHKEQQRIYLAKAHAQHQAQAQAQAKLAAAANDPSQQRIVQEWQVQTQAAPALVHPQMMIRSSTPPVNIPTQRRPSGTPLRLPPYPPATPSPPPVVTSQVPTPHSSRSEHPVNSADCNLSCSDASAPSKPPNIRNAITMPNDQRANGFGPPLINAMGYSLPINNHDNTQSQKTEIFSAAHVQGSSSANVNLNGSSRAATYVGHVPDDATYNVPMTVQGGGSLPMNMNLKPPTSRSMQWAVSQGSDLVSSQPVGSSPHGIPVIPSLPPCLDGVSSTTHPVAPPRTSQSPSMHQRRPLIHGAGWQH
ncbi:enhancer of polycomb-like-domain-containing protein [Amylostereum chailletii]|nr:enhancer of polycomb-like-domain-containing protein [Amylostereum chailletii]